jgi:hypothetical protein
MTRQIKINSYVQVVVDKDNGLLFGRKGIVASYENDKYWVQFDNHPIPLPFSASELKRVNRKMI